MAPPVGPRRRRAAAAPGARHQAESQRTLPYIDCQRCGLRTFAPRSAVRVPECPQCGAALRAAATADAATAVADRPASRLAGTLRLTRDLLGMDVAMVSEIHAGHETARHVAGEWPAIGQLEGASLPLEETFCQRMLAGEIGHVVTDALADERVRDLQMARALGVRAWIGVPLDGELARLYVLCCIAREARPALDERDVFVLRALADSLAGELAAP